MLMAKKQYTIISYYNFIKIKNLFKFKNILNKYTNDLDIKGIILIAPEGLNFSISICFHNMIYLLRDLIHYSNFYMMI